MNVETSQAATVHDRLAALEERVRDLESRAAPGGGTDGAPSVPVDPDRFWALRALEERTEEPGAVVFAGTVVTPDGGRYVWQQGGTVADVLDDDWTVTAEAFAALGHPVRLRLLRAVLRGWTTTAELTEVEHIATTGQLHHHLRPLLAAGWLESPRRGHYAVPARRVVALLTLVEALRR